MKELITALWNDIVEMEEQRDSHLEDAKTYPATSKTYKDKATEVEKKIDRRMQVLEMISR